MLISELPAANSVAFGKWFLKPREINQTIARSCRMVLLEADVQGLPLGRSGTSTLVGYRDRRFVVMTRHQLGIKPNEEPKAGILDTIRVVSVNECPTNIPLSGCLFETSNSDQEYHDLLFFEVSNSWVNSHLDAPYFVPIEGYSKLPRHMSMMFGCPTLPEVMEEYLESFEAGSVGNIHIKTVVAGCRYDDDYISSAEHYRRYLGGPTVVGVDGFSGGPVFSLVGEVGDFRMSLDGIVVRAGNGNIYVVDTDYMTKILKMSIK